MTCLCGLLTDTSDRARLRERFFGASRTVLARL
ncbi:MAG: isopropylmalate isomerase [Rhodobacteraceae bacterium]|nr:isopropylmalate isomerase [Paracoccaceae bacterium]